MITIRPYQESDVESIGQLIADTYSQFNLSFASPEEKVLLLGPFQHARSSKVTHQKTIARALQADIVFVADVDGIIVGILRGKKDKLQSLFVGGEYHRQGIGRKLVEHFEQECVRQGGRQIKVQSTLFAIPFYQAMGYKKTTGVRLMRSFEGNGLKYQPMKKVLPVN